MAPLGIQPAWEAERFAANFRQEFAEKASQVDSIAPAAINGVGAGLEIDRYRNGDSCDHCRMATAFPKILERNISAEAETDQRDPRISCRCECDHCSEITGFTAMIGPHKTVWFRPTSAEIPC